MAVTGPELTGYLKRAFIFLGAALCLFALFLVLRTRAGKQVCTVIYRMVARDPNVEASALQHAVEVLSARLEALRGEFRLAQCSVRPLPPGRLEVRVTCVGDPAAPLAWLALQGRTEFRLLHPRDDILERQGPEGLPPEYEVKVYRERRYALAPLGEPKTVEHRYAVQREPALVVTVFRRVRMNTMGSAKSVVLTFDFKEADARAFGMVTALHAGRKMAMLVDGEMFFPPKQIESAVTTGSVQVQGFFHVPQVRRLVKMLDCGVLPWPLEEVSRTISAAP